MFQTGTILNGTLMAAWSSGRGETVKCVGLNYDVNLNKPRLRGCVTDPKKKK